MPSPENRTPTIEEADNCFPYLEQQIAIIRPEFLCLLGRVAVQAMLNTTLSRWARLRGKWHRYRGIPTIVTYHPAYLLRNPAAKKDAWEDLQMLMKEMGLKVPLRTRSRAVGSGAGSRHLPPRSCTDRPFLAATAARAATATLAAVSPYFSSSASGAPLSPNWSPRLTKRIGHRVRLGDGHGDDAAQAAVGQVFLGDDQGAGLACGGLEAPPVDRLDGVHVEHAGRDPFTGQGLGRVEGRGDHQAVGHDRQVGAVAELVGLADLKGAEPPA